MWIPNIIRIQESTLYFYIALALTLGLIIGAYLQSRAHARLRA